MILCIAYICDSLSDINLKKKKKKKKREEEEEEELLTYTNPNNIEHS